MKGQRRILLPSNVWYNFQNIHDFGYQNEMDKDFTFLQYFYNNLTNKTSTF